MHLVNKGTNPKGHTYLHCSLARKGLCTSKAVRLDKSEEVFRQMLARLDGVALVQDNAGKVTVELQELAGRLAETRTLYREMMKISKTQFFAALNAAAFEVEEDIKALQAKEKLLKKALASERVGSLSEFLARVDLESYGGRSRANTLCKRLGVIAYFGTGCFITEHGKWVLTFVHNEGKIGKMLMEGAEHFDLVEGIRISERLIALNQRDWAVT